MRVFGNKIAEIAREVSELQRASSALREERLLQQSHDEEEAIESSRITGENGADTGIAVFLTVAF